PPSETRCGDRTPTDAGRKPRGARRRQERLRRLPLDDELTAGSAMACAASRQATRLVTITSGCSRACTWKGRAAGVDGAGGGGDRGARAGGGIPHRQVVPRDQLVDPDSATACAIARRPLEPGLLGVVRMADRLADPAVELAALEDHLLRVHVLDGVERHPELARVL